MEPATLRVSYMILGHKTDPYRRLFNEVVEYLEAETARDGEFEDFFIYKNPSNNTTLHFPCIVVTMERGYMDTLFGGEYDEGGTLMVKIMFTHKHVITFDVL